MSGLLAPLLKATSIMIQNVKKCALGRSISQWQWLFYYSQERNRNIGHLPDIRFCYTCCDVSCSLCWSQLMGLDDMRGRGVFTTHLLKCPCNIEHFNSDHCLPEIGSVKWPILNWKCNGSQWKFHIQVIDIGSGGEMYILLLRTR